MMELESLLERNRMFAEQQSDAGGLIGGGEYHLIVLHHTDCGITRLAADTDKLARFFGIRKEDVAGKSVTDPFAAVVGDVATLRGIAALPAGWMLSGLRRRHWSGGGCCSACVDPRCVTACFRYRTFRE